MFPLGGVKQTAAGVPVDNERAVCSPAVYRAISLLSQAMAMLPLPLYEREDEDTHVRRREHRLDYLMNEEANPEMDSFAARRALGAAMVGWGNAFAVKGMVFGEVDSLWPIHPSRVSLTRDERTQQLVYAVKPIKGGGQATPFAADEMFHVYNWSWDGLTGINPIQVHANAIGANLATQQFASSLWSSGGVPAGLLKYATKKEREDKDEIKRQWRESHANRLEVAVLTGAVEWQSIGVPPEHAQFLETQQFGVVEIARIFGVPPHLLMDLQKATFSNIEQQALEFFTHSLLPWLTAWEKRAKFSLLAESEKPTHFFKHKVDAILRADVQTRYAAYAIGRQWGWLSINDVRRLEDMAPVDNGDEYLSPMNMVTVGEEDEVTKQKNKQLAQSMVEILIASGAKFVGDDGATVLAEKPASEVQDVIHKELGQLHDVKEGVAIVIREEIKRHTDAVQEQATRQAVDGQRCRDASDAVVVEAFRRCIAKEQDRARSAAKQPERFLAWIDEFYGQQERLMADALETPYAVWLAVRNDPANARRYAELAAQAHCDESRALLLAAAEVTKEKFAQSVDTAVAAWSQRSPNFEAKP